MKRSDKDQTARTGPASSGTCPASWAAVKTCEAGRTVLKAARSASGFMWSFARCDQWRRLRATTTRLVALGLLHTAHHCAACRCQFSNPKTAYCHGVANTAWLFCMFSGLSVACLPPLYSILGYSAQTASLSSMSRRQGECYHLMLHIYAAPKHI